MKKKVLVTLLAAMMVAAVPMSALAAKSPSTHSSDSDTWTTPAPVNGTSTTTSDGKSLETNGAGSNTANVKAEFAIGASETAGLPEAVVAAIKGINSGTAPAAAVGNAELEGYAALTQTSAVVVQDITTKAVANQEVTLTIYIPNLIEGLQNVKILYYENATGLWKAVDPIAIDFSKKTVTFKMYGSGTVTVIHK